jgi:hypothetical protein
LAGKPRPGRALSSAHSLQPCSFTTKVLRHQDSALAQGSLAVAIRQPRQASLPLITAGTFFFYHRASSNGNFVVRQIRLGGYLSRPVLWRAEHTRKCLGGKKGRDVWKVPVHDCHQCGACLYQSGIRPRCRLHLPRQGRVEPDEACGPDRRPGRRQFLSGDPRPRRRQQSQLRRFARQSRRALPLCHLPVPAYQLSPVRGRQRLV